MTRPSCRVPLRLRVCGLPARAQPRLDGDVDDRHRGPRRDRDVGKREILGVDVRAEQGHVLLEGLSDRPKPRSPNRCALVVRDPHSGLIAALAGRSHGVTHRRCRPATASSALREAARERHDGRRTLPGAAKCPDSRRWTSGKDQGVGGVVGAADSARRENPGDATARADTRRSDPRCSPLLLPDIVSGAAFGALRLLSRVRARHACHPRWRPPAVSPARLSVRSRQDRSAGPTPEDSRSRRRRLRRSH